jgi:hypothetical protein
MGGVCFKSAANNPRPEAQSSERANGADSAEVSASAGALLVLPNMRPKRMINPPPQWRDDSIKTPDDLQKKRAEFWETASAYDPPEKLQMWMALKMACEAASIDEAEAVITASEITLPNSNLLLAYDALGHQYVIPPYCVSEPTSFASKKEPARALPTSPAGNKLAFKLQLPPDNRRVSVRLSSESTISQVKEHVEAEYSVPALRQRYFFGGQILKDDTKLSETAIETDLVVLVQVMDPS